MASWMLLPQDSLKTTVYLLSWHITLIQRFISVKLFFFSLKIILSLTILLTNLREPCDILEVARAEFPLERFQRLVESLPWGNWPVLEKHEALTL